MSLATKAEWEKAAHLEGLMLVGEPDCPDCHGEGVVEFAGYVGSGAVDESRRVPCPCGGAYVPTCPESGESYASGTMAWCLVGARLVSVASQIGCSHCGDHPRALGEDVCPACLECAPTVRGCDLEMAVAS